MNSYHGIGRLTKDPELRYTASSNEPVCNFTIAINEGKDRTTFVPVVVFKEQATNCHKWLTKGQYAGVEGRLSNRSWEDKDGAKHYITEIVAHRVDFLTTSGQTDEQPEEPKQQDNIEDDLPF